MSNIRGETVSKSRVKFWTFIGFLELVGSIRRLFTDLKPRYKVFPAVFASVSDFQRSNRPFWRGFNLTVSDGRVRPGLAVVGLVKPGQAGSSPVKPGQALDGPGQPWTVLNVSLGYLCSRWGEKTKINAKIHIFYLFFQLT